MVRTSLSQTPNTASLMRSSFIASVLFFFLLMPVYPPWVCSVFILFRFNVPAHNLPWTPPPFPGTFLGSLHFGLSGFSPPSPPRVTLRPSTTLQRVTVNFGSGYPFCPPPPPGFLRLPPFFPAYFSFPSPLFLSGLHRPHLSILFLLGVRGPTFLFLVIPDTPGLTPF